MGRVAIVPTAVVFDYKGRDNYVYVDSTLGLASLESAREGWFPCGTRGVGVVSCGTYFGGPSWNNSARGAAFAAFGTTKVRTSTVVNASRSSRESARTACIG